MIPAGLWIRAVVLAAALPALLAASGAAGASEPAGMVEPAAEALCSVCFVEEGTTGPEGVRATRSHGGVEYRFCSDRCAEKFEKEPSRYIEALTGHEADAAVTDSPPISGMVFPRTSTAPT